MLFPNKSICQINQKIIVSSENKKTHTANNVEGCNVFQYKIDGDIIPTTSPEVRCDYLVENETKQTAYLIELKGTNLLHAVEQIEATINKYSVQLRSYAIKPRIIYRANTHAVQQSKVSKFKIKYKDCIIKTECFSENI